MITGYSVNGLPLEVINITDHLTLSFLTVPSPKLINVSKITNWINLKTQQFQSKVLLNSFPMNGHTLGFCPWNQKLQNFVSDLGFEGLNDNWNSWH